MKRGRHSGNSGCQRTSRFVERDLSLRGPSLRDVRDTRVTHYNADAETTRTSGSIVSKTARNRPSSVTRTSRRLQGLFEVVHLPDVAAGELASHLLSSLRETRQDSPSVKGK